MKQIYGFIRQIGYTTAKDATGCAENMSWITDYCRECGAETYAPFNRHAYAIEGDPRASKQVIPECMECK